MSAAPVCEKSESEFAKLKESFEKLLDSLRELQSAVAKLQSGQNFQNRLLIGVAVGVVLINLA